jgi:hypothetical protein
MTISRENPQRSFDEIFASLNKDQRVACVRFVLPPWSGEGVSIKYLNGMGTTKEVIDELVKQGIVYQVNLQEFALEWLAANQQQHETILKKFDGGIGLVHLTIEEKFLQQRWNWCTELARGNSELIRYQLFSEDFVRFVKSEYGG